MKLTVRTVVLALLAVLLVGALLWVALREEPVAVDLHTLERGPLVVTVDADGRTRIREVYEVAAPISGTARRSPVEAGDPVEAGESVVAVVEPARAPLLDARTRREAQAAVHEAEAALQVAEADLVRASQDTAYAQARYERAEALVERAVSSMTQLEDAGQRLGVASAAEDAARSRVDMARGTLERATAALEDPVEGPRDLCGVRLRAPVDGVVLEVEVVSERPVLAGQPLVSVGDPGDLEIVADLLSADAVRLPDRAAATVERWGGPRPLRARLRRVEPVARTEVSALGIEEQRVDAVFDVLTPAPERRGLAHGFAVFVRVEEWRSDDALLLPLSAAFRLGEDWGVFVEEDGAARERIVRLGRRGPRMTEVLDGLTAAERVVLHPSDAIADGAAVVARP